ncbi:MAG: hypothetical protein A2W35_06590 [Chloroflexi bacterium RBG_16_57_11]|nr:MAG: hypothetical protein A2W35_06590 [Chloroflexi bacterium RBG_16_57_11]HKZ02386.1 hypothetical protein [Pyrinomonadaceae bacterium]
MSEWTEVDEAYWEGLATSQSTMNELLDQCARTAKENQMLKQRLSRAEQPLRTISFMAIILGLICLIELGIIALYIWGKP